jgi:hypothetical protein
LSRQQTEGDDDHQSCRQSPVVVISSGENLPGQSLFAILMIHELKQSKNVNEHECLLSSNAGSAL